MSRPRRFPDDHDLLRCSICRTLKNYKEFRESTHSDGTPKWHSFCDDCRLRYQRIYNGQAAERRRAVREQLAQEELQRQANWLATHYEPLGPPETIGVLRDDISQEDIDLVMGHTTD